MTAKKQVTGYVSPEVYQMLSDMAFRNDRSISYLVGTIIEAYLEQKNGKEK